MEKIKNIADFNKIYENTYKNTLKYIVLNCSKFDDINDLLQDTYFEVFKHLKKNTLKSALDIDAYVIGIAKNIVKKHYKKKYKQEAITNELIEDIENDSSIDIELQFITKDNVDKIWQYIKNKNSIIEKTFYCYYYLDMKIADIALELGMNESTIKNYLYRTIKELKENLNKEVYDNE